MKVIILAGGLPITLIEEDEKMPKPMAEIGRRPLLWHIMKQYDHYGYHDFIICTGYKGDVIKDYFLNFYVYQSDITVDLQTNQVEVHRKQTEDWKVSIIDTGRILSLEPDGTYRGTGSNNSGGGQDAWVNACSMVLEPRALQHLQHPLGTTLMDCLAGTETVQTYRHEGFWSPVETIRDKTWLEHLWAVGLAPWKVWED